MEEIFLGVMDINEAKNHQIRLKALGILVGFKTNGHTCTTGCKVTVEVWGAQKDEQKIAEYFQGDYRKHVRGHEPDPNHLREVFDPSLDMVVCQACGAKFPPALSTCPDCGLCYG